MEAFISLSVGPLLCFQSYTIISKVVFKIPMPKYLSLYGKLWWKENDAYGFKFLLYFKILIMEFKEKSMHVLK